MPELNASYEILALWAVIGYVLGSIPSGVVIAKMMGLGNLRDIGSGNIGATNVLRTGNKTAAALTLLFDAGKGAVAVLAGMMLVGNDAAQVAGLFAMIGHCFPVWLKFKGGKGVATYFGVIFAVSWPLGLASAGTWLTVAWLSRYSSLAALLTSGMAITWLFLLRLPDVFLLTLVLALLIYNRHSANIKRLKSGEEPKIGK